MKCADISNPCRNWEVCLAWANFITEEFFRQTDREKMLSLQTVPGMDRELTTVPRVQIGRNTFTLLSFVIYGTHLWQGIAGSLTGVSWRCDNSRAASPTMTGRFGAPRWVEPTSVPDQQLIYPLGGALRYLFSSACRTQGANTFTSQPHTCVTIPVNLLNPTHYLLITDSVFN